MWLIFVVALILVVVFFGNTMMTVIKTFFSNQKPTLQIGNIWFIGLLVVNIIIIAFIYGFYYYKINTNGTQGYTGEPGFTGRDGEECIIVDQNCKYNVPINKMTE